jgi:hypothetical protein
VAIDSAAGQAWMLFDRIVGSERLRLGRGRISVAMPEPPKVIADGCMLISRWIEVPEGSRQFAAWVRRLREYPRVVIGLRTFRLDGKLVRGLRVPSEWPPAKLIAGTLCTDEDAAELARA